MRWLLLIALLIAPPVVFPQAKEKVIVLSWGDMIGSDQYRPLDTAEGVAEAVRAVKRPASRRSCSELTISAPADTRSLCHRQQRLSTLAQHDPKGLGRRNPQRCSGFGEAGRYGDPDVDLALRRGLPAQSPVLRPGPVSGSPAFPATTHSTCRTTGVSIPTGGNTTTATSSSPIPRCRRYTLDVIRKFSDAFPFDGVFLSVRSHSPPPDHADQFGFNEPIVREFERRYSKNILRQSFDLEAWRVCRRILHHAPARGTGAPRLSRAETLLGVPQGEHVGPPIGNMRIDWQRWVSERMVDELVVGRHTLERATYPLRWQRGYGYVQNQDERGTAADRAVGA